MKTKKPQRTFNKSILFALLAGLSPDIVGLSSKKTKEFKSPEEVKRLIAKASLRREARKAKALRSITASIRNNYYTLSCYDYS